MSILVDRSLRAFRRLADHFGGRPHLTIDDVRNMALARGVATIEEIELDHGIWEVQGRDASGHKIEMKVDALSGEILKMRRND